MKKRIGDIPSMPKFRRLHKTLCFEEGPLGGMISTAMKRRAVLAQIVPYEKASLTLDGCLNGYMVMRPEIKA